MDTLETHVNPNPELSEAFLELLGLFVQQSFATNNGFEELTFEEAGLILEEPFGGDSHLVESYDSCKSTYCLMLIDLELQGLTSLPPCLSHSSLRELSELVLEKAVALPEKTQTTIEAIPAPVLEKISEALPNLVLDLEGEPETALNDVPNTPTAPDAGPVLQALAREYLNLANSFKSDVRAIENTLSSEASYRSHVHFQIGACEIELFGRMKNDLERIWKERTHKIQSLVRSDSFVFNEESENLFATHEKLFSQWLFDQKFPKLAALHCLKYLTLTSSLDRLHPSVFELGTLIYFWGLSNENTFTALAGLQNEQIIELAFRLFRLDRIKANASNFNRDLSPQLVAFCLEDCSKILELLNTTTSAPEVKNVA